MNFIKSIVILILTVLVLSSCSHWVMMGKGKDLYQDKRYEEAIQVLNQSLSIKKNIGSYYWLTLTYLGTKNYDKAKSTVLEGLTYFPNEWLLNNLAGTMFLDIESKPSLALPYLKKAYNNKQLDSLARQIARAEYLINTEQVVVKSTPMTSSDMESLLQQAGRKLIEKQFTEVVLLLENKLPQNISELDGTKAALGHYAIGHNNLGIAYLRLGKIEKAIEELSKSKEALPRWPASYYLLGQAYHFKKEYNKSIDNLENGILLDSNAADQIDLHCLIIDYLKINNKEKALTVYNTLQKKYGEHLKSFNFSTFEKEAAAY